MRFRPPIFILPPLILGAVLLDLGEKSLELPAGEVGSHPESLASTIITSNEPRELELPTVMDRVSGLFLPTSVSLHSGTSISQSSSITINFDLSRPGFARLSIFDTRGRCVRQLADEVFNRGSHQLRWDGCDENGGRVDDGVYFARLESLGEVSSIRMRLDS